MTVNSLNINKTKKGACAKVNRKLTVKINLIYPRYQKRRKRIILRSTESCYCLISIGAKQGKKKQFNALFFVVFCCFHIIRFNLFLTSLSLFYFLLCC